MEFLIVIGLLLGVLWWIIGFILPKDVRNEVLAEIIHDTLQSIWSLIFGPPRVSINDKKKQKKSSHKTKLARKHKRRR